MESYMQWLKKNKDWLITLAVFLVFAILLLLYSTFLRNGDKDEHVPVVMDKPLTFELAQDGETQGEDDPQTSAPVQTTSFFLEPGPEELIKKLENLNYQEFKEETKNLPGLRVMWPAYFFSARTTSAGKAEVLLDASETGFGATLLTTIDTTQYPEILKLKKGTKIWLAGEIKYVDPTGTGQFVLETEYVRFDDYQPPTKPTVDDPETTGAK